MNISESLSGVHKPTLGWSTGISGTLLIVVAVLLIIWIIKRDKREN